MATDITNIPIYHGAPVVDIATQRQRAMTMRKGDVWDIAISTAVLKTGRPLKMVVKDIAGQDRADTVKVTVDVYDALRVATRILRFQ